MLLRFKIVITCISDWVSQSVTAELKRPQLLFKKIFSFFFTDKKIGREQTSNGKQLLLSLKNVVNRHHMGVQRVLPTVEQKTLEENMKLTEPPQVVVFPPFLKDSALEGTERNIIARNTAKKSWFTKRK